MADYQVFASNVLRAMAPQQDETRRNMLLVHQLQGAQEDRALRREENALNRGFRERQMVLSERADERAAGADQRSALASQLDTADKVSKRAIAYATAANSPEAWDANVERFARELDGLEAGLGDQVRAYKGRFAEKDAIIASMVSPDTRFSADQAAQRQQAGFEQQQTLQGQQQGFTAGQNQQQRDFLAAQQAEKIAAERELAGAKSAKDAAKTGFEQEDKLRDEYTKAAGDFVKVRDSYGRILASGRNPSPAGDISLVYGFMKMQDPGSTVREGEYATAENSGGIGARLRNIYNKMLSGEKLTPEQRADFVQQAGMLYKQQERFHQSNVERYTGLANQYGLDPSRVVVDLGGGLPDANEPVVDLKKKYGLE